MFEHGFRPYALLTLMLTAAALAPSSLLAQQKAEPGPTAAVAVAEVAVTTVPTGPGPRVAAATWAPARLQFAPARWAASDPGDVVVQDRINAGPNIAMMAVGGAGMVVGLLVGGDAGLVILASSGVVGLVGLYRYLR
jgi:hypothetical protein